MFFVERHVCDNKNIISSKLSGTWWGEYTKNYGKLACPQKEVTKISHGYNCTLEIKEVSIMCVKLIYS